MLFAELDAEFVASVPDDDEEDDELEPDVEAEVEFGLALLPGVEATPPQPTSVAAASITRQVFTGDTPA